MLPYCSCAIFRAFLGLLVTVQLVLASDIGTDNCDCLPGTFSLVFDFAQPTCPVQGFGTPGLFSREPQCDAEDPVQAVRVTRLVVQELDTEGFILGQQTFDGDFVQGSSIPYSTRSQTAPGEIATVADLTARLLFLSFGRTQADESVTQRTTLYFSNDCAIYPTLFEEEDKAGWIRFENIGVPPMGFCPISETFTIAPTAVMSQAPSSIAPVTDVPTQQAASTTMPTPLILSPNNSSSPTRVPTTSPTSKPTLAPTDGPTQSPTTSFPTSSPTGAPTSSPTLMPTPALMMLPSTPGPTPTTATLNPPTQAPTSKGCRVDNIILSWAIMSLLALWAMLGL